MNKEANKTSLTYIYNINLVQSMGGNLDLFKLKINVF